MQPPKHIQKILEKLCPDYLWEAIAGDLEEEFYLDIEQYGLGRAKRRYTLNAIRFMRPGILLRNKFQFKNNNLIMVSNYLKTASRNMVKQKLFTFINAFGLSIGIAFCILIYLFVKDENSFDTFHQNADNIYRIEEFSYRTWNPEPDNLYNQSAYLQVGLAPTLKEELPEVKYATRFNEGAKRVVKYKDMIFSESVSYTDTDFFNMFSFPVIAGNKESFLSEPSQVVITESIAQKYFGSTDALDKVLSIDMQGDKEFVVVGVISDPPFNSSLDFKMLISQVNRGYYKENMTQWRNFSTPTFVQLNNGTEHSQLQTNLHSVRDKLMKEGLEESKKQYSIPDDVIQFEFRATNLLDIHMHKDVSWHKVSDPQYSFILGGLALLIIVIASINYISLALTTSAARRKEVGVRKSIGATKNQLAYQFTLESVLVSILSMILGVILMMTFLPNFNDFTSKSIEVTPLILLEVLGISLLLSVFVGLIAGSYPSFVLSAFNPASVLKGGGIGVKVKSGLAKPLVLLQFTLSSVLIISAFVMYQQMYFMTSKDLGFDKEQVLVVPTQLGWTDDSDQSIERMRNALASNPNVVSVSGVSNSFSHGWSRYGYEIDGENKAAYVWAVDPEYLTTMGIELVEGRDFDPSKVSDTTALIVNEALVADMGWENPLNEYLNWREDSVGPGFQIIGVAKNYHFRSLEIEVEPLFLSINKEEMGHLRSILIKMKSGDLSETISQIEETYKEVIPDKPFEYSFLDEDVDKQYASFEQWMNIMSFSTLFAILISALGLFGLAGINAVNRTKEIGIRKVFGAPVLTIFLLLNRQYVSLASLSFVIAAPLAWYLMDSWWLSDFEFRIEMSWQLFGITFLIGMAVAILTVSYHGIKAAWINPAETLKHE